MDGIFSPTQEAQPSLPEVPVPYGFHTHLAVLHDHLSQCLQ